MTGAAAYPLPVDDAEGLFRALMQRVDLCLVTRGCFEIVEVNDGRYVQYLVDQQGGLVVETVSQEFLEHAAARPLTPHDELVLMNLGWRPPDEDSPNWHRPILDASPWPAPLAAELLTRTLIDVHRVDLDTLVARRHDASPKASVKPCGPR